MLKVLSGVLCQQKHFSEAESLLKDQKRELSAHGCPPRDLLNLEKNLGEVLARAGDASKALAILMSVATNELGTASDCVSAAFVAIGSGDMAAYRHLCAIGLARFTAGAEGIYALSLSDMLLAAPQDEVVTQVASVLVGRVEQARDFSKNWSVGVRGWLHYREGRLVEVAALGSEASIRAASTGPIVARINKSYYHSAIIGFRSALAYCHLDRFVDARLAYEDGLRKLGPLPTAERPGDLGDAYAAWYLAEAHRREAEQVFKTKGIAMPDNALPLK
jgi:hypothetical protein